MDTLNPKKCPELHSIPPGGLIRGNINKTLLHDVNLVMTHVTYNISNILQNIVILMMSHMHGYSHESMI